MAVDISTKDFSFYIPTLVRGRELLENKNILLKGNYRPTVMNKVRRWLLGDPLPIDMSIYRILRELGFDKEAKEILSLQNPRSFEEKMSIWKELYWDIGKDFDPSILGEDLHDFFLNEKCPCTSLELVAYLRKDPSKISYDLLTEEERDQASSILGISRKELKSLLRKSKTIMKDKYPRSILQEKCVATLLSETPQVIFAFCKSPLDKKESGEIRCLVSGFDGKNVTIEYDPDLHPQALRSCQPGQVIKILGYERDIETGISYATSILELN